VVLGNDDVVEIDVDGDTCLGQFSHGSTLPRGVSASVSAVAGEGIPAGDEPGDECRVFRARQGRQHPFFDAGDGRARTR
ncbi:hypothetical protein, partial [Pseudomonas sp. RTS4]|uniref:hypothetical protein n=1 Tax=Pseudomonas sp. RTS4 TaxID=3048644 RepID=UPI002B230C4E